MPDSGKTPKDHFILQRRNLIIISLCAIFFKAAKLEIDKLNFFGNQTSIGNPSIAIWCITGFFIYFLWRYYTACRDIGGVSKFYRSVCDKQNDTMRNYILSTLHKRAQKAAIAKDAYQLNLPQDEDGFTTKGNIVNPATMYLHPSNEQKITRDAALQQKVGSIDLNLLQTSAHLVRATIYCILNRTEFGEYMVPYVLALWAGLELSGLQLTEGLVARLAML